MRSTAVKSTPGATAWAVVRASASLIGIDREKATFHFTATPADPHWSEVELG